MRSTTFIAFLLTLTQLVSAQTNDYNFINFSSKNGLSSNSVYAVLKDRFGYMWFATDDGLNKFDGVNFTVYRHKVNDSTSIGAGRALALKEDHRGNLWVGAGNTLSMYNRERDAFINYTFSNDAIRSLCVDHEGNIWIGTYLGLLLFDPITNKIIKYKADPGRANQLKSDVIISIIEDRHQRVWIGTIEGLHLYTKTSNSFTRFLPDKNDLSSLPEKIIRTITEDSSGNIWVGTKSSGLSLLQPDGKTFRTYTYNPADETTLSNNSIYAIEVDKGGKLWVGTENGLNIFDPKSGKASRIINDVRHKNGFAGKAVRSIFIGKDGIYWIGTEAGINKYDKNLAYFNLCQGNPNDPLGLSSSAIMSFAENKNGDIYIGTDGGGLNLYHRNTGLFDHLPFTAGDNNRARSILAMERVGNELWLGTYPDGVYVLNTVTGATRHYTEGNGAKFLSNNEIFCIKKDSKGNVWVGTNGNGLNKYNPVSGTFERFDPKDPKETRTIFPENGFIRSIEEDRSGRIWIGSHGSGIAVYDPVHATFQTLKHDNSGLAQDNVLSVYCSRDGKIWAGTAGEGLCLFDYNTNKFTTYSGEQGLANGYIYKILEDDAGKLWLSTNKGISSFDPQSKQFKNYSYYHGVQQSTFSLGAGLKTSNGEMFFGGLDGFNYFNPLTLHSNKNVPSLVLTDLKISNRSVIPGEHSAINNHISVAKEIRLSYKQNFSIDFVALNYTVPQESQYSYMLDGFDKNWNDVGSAKTAVYTNLSPGKYTFKLKARSDDGLWQTPEASINIYVKPPFWLTIWAYALYILVAGFILWAIRYRGIQKLKREFALEQERQQFKRMLEEERREAERKHEFDEVKIKFLTNLSHEFRTPISLIVGPVESLVQHETSDKKREQLSLVKRNARRLLNLVNQLLDFRKLEESELKLNMTEDDLVFFVKELSDSFKDISERKHIHFTFTSDIPHYYTSFDKDKIERILFNLLSNAFKFTKEGGSVWLKMEKEFDSDIRLIVADTGVGMTADTQEKIFERFFQGDTNTGIMNQGSGIGLSITREFVKLHGGTIRVESIQGKGSTFTVQLPCKSIPIAIEDIAHSSIKPGEHVATDTEKDKEISTIDKPTVLLIEDHEDFRKYLRDNLSSYYKIVEAADGREGWQKILSAHPQVIVSDINMPEMDGIVLCRKVRSDKRTSHIPIVLLTALTGDANQLRGLNTGANDYLTKPFNFDILHAKIRNLLHLNQNLKSVYKRQLDITSPNIEVQSEDEKLLLKITRYVESNLDSADLSVEDLSKHVYMSRGTLYTKIVNLTGETPVEFIRSIKLNKAAALLENTDMKISQVGYEVGFTTPNYFARAFKAKFNLSPTEYMHLKRKRH